MASIRLRPTWRRRRLVVIPAAAALGAAFVLSTDVAGAASGPSALDYAQCSNGADGTTPDPDCAWINGVLNANNSQYHEDQVTPQRLTLSVTDAGGGSHTHSVTLKYLDRKGGIHAYDYLAAANATVADALDLRCLGITSICPGGSGVSHATTDDTNQVGPATNGYSKVVSTHDAGLTADQKLLWLYGATFATGGDSTTGWPVNTNPPAMTLPTHDNAAVDTGDDYATTTISFVTTGAGKHNVQLLFGGHLAAGSQDDGWGDGLGASSVNGGPYHIKWAAADGLSVGNRDNQIMSNAILPIIPQGGTLSTTPSVTSAVAGSSDLSSVTDGASYDPDSGHAPTGSMTFDLYGPLSPTTYNDCTDPDLVNSVDGNRVSHEENVALTGSGPYSATSTGVDMTGLAPGVYQFVARYVAGTDVFNLDVDGTCGDSTERVVIVGGLSTQTITDTVSVSGIGTPTGHVDWSLYTTANCTDDGLGDPELVFSDVWVSDDPLVDPDSQNNILNGSGSATSEAFTPDPAAGGTTYYWKVDYSGDTNNAGGTIESCGVQQITVQNEPS